MSSLRNTPFGKRLRASQGAADGFGTRDDESSGPNKRQRVNPIFAPAAASTSTANPAAVPASSSVAASPVSSSSSSTAASTSTAPTVVTPAYGDRFIPRREGDIRTSYHLIDDAAVASSDGSGSGSKEKKRGRVIQPESDALKEQANQLFNGVLREEVTPSSSSSTTPVSRPSSPVRPTTSTAGQAPSTPTRGRTRLFAYASPSTPPRANSPSKSPERRGLDSPSNPAYSLSPIRSSSRSLLQSPQRKLRSVCKTPYRVLDAPELAEDFYLNLVDWSSTNVLGVGLGSCVYLWSARDAAVSKLCDLGIQTESSTQNDLISSVAWVQKGSTLAVATLMGRLNIYDAPTLRLIRSYPNAHAQRIGALAWNGQVLSSGSRDRTVHHRDVRAPNRDPWKRSVSHRQEVCGLKWSSAYATTSSSSSSGDGALPIGSEVYSSTALLASGGNDNKVCVWDLRGSGRNHRSTAGSSGVGVGGGVGRSGPGIGTNNSTIFGSTGVWETTSELPTPTNVAVPPDDIFTLDAGESRDAAPLWKFHEHTAAVKALAWDPHMPYVLATGGGTQDKHIRFWNTINGSMLNELDTGSQVCNLTWSLTSHELVSTHGYSSTTAQNQICIWKYPTLDMVASLGGHTNRVLYLAMSPDGETIVTGAGDETLRFWNAFPRKDTLGGGASGGSGAGAGASDDSVATGSSGSGASEGGVERGGSLDWGRLIR